MQPPIDKQGELVSGALEVVPARQMPAALPAEIGLTPERAFLAVQDGTITAEKLQVMKDLLDLSAKRQFAAAKVALQGDLRSVQATRPVPNNDGSVRYNYAPFEDIMAEVGPKLEKHGFTVSFSTDFAEGRLIKLCTLQHVAGHSETTKFAVRIGSGPPKATECQADGAASTYAKRFALCDALNIRIDHDSDGRAEGGSITPEQAEELERRVAETNSNKSAFLKFAGGAKSFSEIPASAYDRCDAMLRRKEAAGR